MTTQLREWVSASPTLYPVLEAGAGGLKRQSAVMLDHLRGIGAERVIRPLGRLSDETYRPIRAGLEKMFDFVADE